MICRLQSYRYIIQEVHEKCSAVLISITIKQILMLLNKLLNSLISLHFFKMTVHEKAIHFVQKLLKLM